MDFDRVNCYIDYINGHVLPVINYAKLQKDYQTEKKEYARSVLNVLHRGVLDIYGKERFDPDDPRDSVLLLPGVARSVKDGNMCIVLLSVELSSPQSICVTDFLTKYGCISPEQPEITESVYRFLEETYGEYDFGCTAVLKDGTCIGRGSMEKEIRDMLENFRSFVFEPCSKEEMLDNICDYVEEEAGEQEDMEWRGW